VLDRGISLKKYLSVAGNIFIYGGVYIGLQTFVFLILTIVFSVVQEMANQGTSDIEGAIETYLIGNSNIVLIFSGLVSVFIYAAILRYKGERFRKYCNFEKVSLKNVMLIIIMGLGFNLFIQSILIQLPIEEMFPEYIETMEAIAGGGQNELLVLLGVGVLIPIFEEILFRGMILNELKKHFNIKTSVIIQALLFGIFHWNLLQGTYASILGIILGLICIWTGSIWAPIVAHIIFNSASFFYGYINTYQNPVIMLLVGLLVSIVSILVLYRVNKKVVVFDNVGINIDNVIN
jgi:uncharacterized protein